jgi:hypothetical protein
MNKKSIIGLTFVAIGIFLLISSPNFAESWTDSFNYHSDFYFYDYLVRSLIFLFSGFGFFLTGLILLVSPLTKK